ncbi:MAG TPA: Hsp70 family protein, partial [Polyangia bacterium]
AAQPSPPRPGAPAVLRGAAAAIGIDFGTSYTRVAVNTPAGVHLFTDDRGRAMLPSVVSYLDDGSTLVGWDARERLGTDPQRTVAAPKRLLGRTIDSPEIQGMLASAGYGSERGPRDAVLLRLGGETLAVPQVCAVIIRQACRLAQQQLGTRSIRAVLTMPVTFGREGEDALRRAAQLAGVEVIGLMKEPVAAALAYGFEQRTNAIAAVYDFGGGTFDFSVLDFRGERFRVLATSGDAWLGGEDFDLALAQWAADQFWRRTGIQVRQRAVEWQRLLLAAEEAKRQLTVTPGAVVDVPAIVLAPAPTDLRVAVTEATLRELCRELVERSLDVCREGLAAAQLGPRDLAQLVLTGGTSQMPLVQDAVSGFFEREVRLTVNPDVAVVQGAAIRASWLARRAAGAG